MTHTVVIGAGIIGASIAEALTRRGATVTIIDAAPAGSGTTASSLAWFNANDRHPRTYHDLAVGAITEWQNIASRYADPEWFHSSGNLMWAETDDDRSRLAQQVSRLRTLDYPAVELTPAQASKLEPELRPPPDAYFAFFPQEGYVDGRQAVAAFLARVTDAGGQVIERDPVASLHTSANRITGVGLASGRTVSGDQYVCCAGWQTPRLLAQLGIGIPLEPADEPKAHPPCLVDRRI